MAQGLQIVVRIRTTAVSGDNMVHVGRRFGDAGLKADAAKWFGIQMIIAYMPPITIVTAAIRSFPIVNRSPVALMGGTPAVPYRSLRTAGNSTWAEWLIW